MTLSDRDWKRLDILVANLQSRNARLAEMEEILTSYHNEGYPGCFAIAISSKSDTISPTISRLLDEYPGCFRLVKRDGYSCVLFMRTVMMHKYRAIRKELWEIPMTIRMRGSTFHLTLQ